MGNPGRVAHTLTPDQYIAPGDVSTRQLESSSFFSCLQPETGKSSSGNSMYVYTYIGGDNAIYAIYAVEFDLT